MGKRADRSYAVPDCHGAAQSSSTGSAAGVNGIGGARRTIGNIRGLPKVNGRPVPFRQPDLAVGRGKRPERGASGSQNNYSVNRDTPLMFPIVSKLLRLSGPLSDGLIAQNSSTVTMLTRVQSVFSPR